MGAVLDKGKTGINSEIARWDRRSRDTGMEPHGEVVDERKTVWCPGLGEVRRW